MNATLWISVIAAIATCAAAAAAVRGLRYARGLIDVAVNDRQVDRVLTLHKEVTTGEIAAARNRFSELMYRAGEEAFGPRKCWRPDWESLVPPNPAVASSLIHSRFLRALTELAMWMEGKDWRGDPRNAYRKVPEESFPGTEDQVPRPTVSTLRATATIRPAGSVAPRTGKPRQTVRSRLTRAGKIPRRAEPRIWLGSERGCFADDQQ